MMKLFCIDKVDENAYIILQDPEDPDFSGVVDFSNAVPGPDGSWCITKVNSYLLPFFMLS